MPLPIEEYLLYGQSLKVTRDMGSKSKRFTVMEGLQYITDDDKEIYVLVEILPDEELLIGYEFYTGETGILRMHQTKFCERPEQEV